MDHIHSGWKSSDLNIQPDVGRLRPWPSLIWNEIFAWCNQPNISKYYICNFINLISTQLFCHGRHKLPCFFSLNQPKHIYILRPRYITNFLLPLVWNYITLNILNHKKPPTDNVAKHPRDMAFCFSLNENFPIKHVFK